MTHAPASVRIVAWNCNGGLDGAKAAALAALEPDVAVVPEAAETARVPGLVQIGWTGRLPKKGLAVYARPELEAVVDASFDPAFEWFLPVRLPGLDFDVLAVWAMNRDGGEGVPRWRTRRALGYYAPLLARRRAVVLGDFNDNLRWDRPGYPSFAGTMEELGAKGYVSLHHARTAEPHGAEPTASLYWRRKLDAPYLVDHVFLPEEWLGSVVDLEIGAPDPWLAHSDHMPLVVDLVVPPANGGIHAGGRKKGAAQPVNDPIRN